MSPRVPSDSFRTAAPAASRQQGLNHRRAVGLSRPPGSRRTAALRFASLTPWRRYLASPPHPSSRLKVSTVPSRPGAQLACDIDRRDGRSMPCVNPLASHPGGWSSDLDGAPLCVALGASPSRRAPVTPTPPTASVAQVSVEGGGWFGRLAEHAGATGVRRAGRCPSSSPGTQPRIVWTESDAAVLIRGGAS